MDDISDYDDAFFELDLNPGNFVRLSHLNNKSSVLSPESRNITSQYLALQQLDAHQRIVSRAKSTIDTSAPKSLQSYISVVDRQRKKSWRKLNNELNNSNIEMLDHNQQPANSSRMQNTFSEEDDNLSLNTSVNKGVQMGIPFRNFSSRTADKITWYLEALRHGELQSPLFLGTDIGRNSKQSHSSDGSSSKRVVRGDLMDWHNDSFVKSRKPFSPRILAGTDAKSRLRDMRCYNPPSRRKKNSSSHSSDTFESYDQEDESNEDGNESHHSNNSSSVEEESQVNRTPASENMHNLKSSIPHSIHPRNQYFETLDHLRSLRRTHENDHFHADHENEEDKYLNFLSKVTEDILRSGVYSDRAIQQTFEFHMQFYEDEANKDKLQSLLSQILDGLKISSDESEDAPCRRNPLLVNFGRPDSPPEKESPDTLPAQIDLKIETDSRSRTADEFDTSQHSINHSAAEDIHSDKTLSQNYLSVNSANES